MPSPYAGALANATRSRAYCGGGYTRRFGRLRLTISWPVFCRQQCHRKTKRVSSMGPHPAGKCVRAASDLAISPHPATQQK